MTSLSSEIWATRPAFMLAYQTETEWLERVCKGRIGEIAPASYSKEHLEQYEWCKARNNKYNADLQAAEDWYREAVGAK